MYKESLNSFIIHISFFTATYALLSSSVAPPVQCLQLVSVILSGLKTCSQGEAWCGWQASPASANDWDARKACPDPYQTRTHTNLCATNNIHSGTCTRTHTLAQQVCESLWDAGNVSLWYSLSFAWKLCHAVRQQLGMEVTDSVTVWFKQDCCEFGFNLVRSVDTIHNSFPPPPQLVWLRNHKAGHWTQEGPVPGSTYLWHQREKVDTEKQLIWLVDRNFLPQHAKMLIQEHVLLAMLNV